MSQRFVLSFLSLFIFAACASKPKLSALPRAALTVTNDDPRIGTYISSWKGFRTSSYWIQAPEGLVLIDTQFLLSAAEEMIAAAEAATGKKVILAIVLHPNPDKFNGAAVLAKRGIKVISSAQVVGKIPAVHTLRKEWFFDRFAPDYPAELPKVEAFGSATQDYDVGGIRLRLHVLGAGCSEAHLAVQFEDHLFVGDLATKGFHSWLELGLLDEWVKRLDELMLLKPKYVHTGRGASGEGDILSREKEYLVAVQEIVSAKKPRPGKVLSKSLAKEIRGEIVARYPAYDYPLFISNGLEALWARMSRRP
jgi:glyoxylase-like metal-dependent hydrolase (beta-lactamase superfamily II)